MLQLIRDRAQGFVVGVIVLFICLTFALWGIDEYIGSGSAVIVAEVNGDEVELNEFQRMFQRIRQQAQILYGEQFNEAQWSGEQAKLSTLDQVVDERVLLGLAADSNMRISDRQVFEQIRNNDQFRDEDGRFSQQTYSTIVGYMGFSEIGFEQQMRRDLILNQLRTGIAGSAFVTPREARLIEQMRKQQRDIAYGVIPVETFKDEATPSDDEIEAFYQQDTERYRIAEKASLEYVTLSIEQLMKEVAPDEQALVEYYEANSGNYTQDERRNANHILIQIKRDAPQSAADEALEKAHALRVKALETDASFEDLAKENSDDIGSRTEGGETGLFGRGVMAPEFEEAVFAMEVGDISEPIRTDFGYHIIRLKDIKEGGLQSFDEARRDVEEQYRREQAEAIFYEQAEQLTDLAYEQPDSLEPLADAVNLEIKKTAMADRNELALSLPLEAVNAAFADETLIDGLNSQPVETNNGEVIVVRVAEHQASRIAPLEEVREEVIASIRNKKAREATAALGEKLLARLKAGEDPQTLLSTEQIEWKEHPAQGSDSSKVNRAVLRAAFKAPAPVAGEATYIGVPYGVGDYALVKVSNVTYPSSGEVVSADVRAVQNTVSRNRVISDWRNFVAANREKADVELFPGNL
ncbi:MAG: SurA N-terminal domain-containing protein [Gammaproteobacteria bacterium]